MTAIDTTEFAAEDIARGDALFRAPCDFVRGVVAIDGLPADGRPEIAFAGRSNVGKSSLINALTGRKTLARVSVTPGRTRELNFFTLGVTGPNDQAEPISWTCRAMVMPRCRDPRSKAGRG